MSGTVADKATAFKNELTGSTTNKIVCKASNHDVAGPKKKHVDYLINLTNDPQCSMATLSDLLFERMKNTSWVVVFKNLVVAHNLLTLGSERFLQCVATRATSFTLDTFMDRTDSVATNMSMFVRKYAKYLGFMCSSYKTLATDLCRMPKGEESPLRTMEPVKLLKTTASVQQQMDLMLDVEVSTADLTNGVINTAFLMLYKDLIKLYTVYNDAIINILEKFFEMKKPQCKEAIATYRKFITRQEGINDFLKLAEDVGVDRQTHLNIRQVPEDLLPALEAHLSEMDTIKKTAGAQASPQIKAASEKLAQLHSAPVTDGAAVSSTDEKTISPLVASSFATASSMPGASSDVLDAQKKRFEELKRQAGFTSEAERPTGENVPFNESVPFNETATFSAPQSSAPQGNEGSLLGDLVGLQGFSQPPPSSLPPPSSSFSSSNPFQTDSFSSSQPWASGPSGYQEVDLFTEIRGKPQPDFDSVFGSTTASQGIRSKSLMGGGILTPEAVGVHASMQPSFNSSQDVSGLTTDVESSLARAAENLSLNMGNKTGMVKKTEHQWKPSGPLVKTGGDHFMPMQIQPKTLHPQPPTSHAGGQPANWSGNMHVGHFPLQPNLVPPMQQQFGQPLLGGGMGIPQQQMMWQQHPPQQQDLFGPQYM